MTEHKTKNTIPFDFGDRVTRVAKVRAEICLYTFTVDGLSDSYLNGNYRIEDCFKADDLYGILKRVAELLEIGR